MDTKMCLVKIFWKIKTTNLTNIIISDTNKTVWGLDKSLTFTSRVCSTLSSLWLLSTRRHARLGEMLAGPRSKPNWRLSAPFLLTDGEIWWFSAPAIPAGSRCRCNKKLSKAIGIDVMLSDQIDYYITKQMKSRHQLDTVSCSPS